MTPHAQKTLETLWRLSGDGEKALRPNGLKERLRAKSGLSEHDIGVALQELREEGQISCAKWLSTPTRPGAMLSVIRNERQTPMWVESWRILLEQSSLGLDEIEALRPIGEFLQGFGDEANARLISGLKQLRREQASQKGLPLYDVSARYLLGSSKLLERIRKPAIAFGINVDAFAQAHKYLAVAGPKEPKAVVLVENPHAFETASQAQTNCAWACTYGFGLALGKDERHGQMLVENLTGHIGTLKTLVRSGNPPPLGNLLGHPALFFWGDLDPAGLMIFSQLRASFPQIQLSALYLPMIEKLKAGNGHPYHHLSGKNGQVHNLKIEETLSVLASICAENGVDQETVLPEQVEVLAGTCLVFE
jgi:hypothetical protein